MIAYDDVKVAERPVRWDMHRVLTMSTVLGVLGVVASFLLFLLAERYVGMSRPTIQTQIFLKRLVAGHLTIYLTRNQGWFWERPWPNWRLIVASETTQVLGTLAAVYGWFVPPIGWGYALGWLLVNNLAKVWTHRAMRNGMAPYRRHFDRVGPRPVARPGLACPRARVDPQGPGIA